MLKLCWLIFFAETFTFMRCRQLFANNIQPYSYQGYPIQINSYPGYFQENAVSTPQYSVSNSYERTQPIDFQQSLLLQKLYYPSYQRMHPYSYPNYNSFSNFYAPPSSQLAYSYPMSTYYPQYQSLYSTQNYFPSSQNMYYPNWNVSLSQTPFSFENSYSNFDGIVDVEIKPEEKSAVTPTAIEPSENEIPIIFLGNDNKFDGKLPPETLEFFKSLSQNKEEPLDGTEPSSEEATTTTESTTTESTTTELTTTEFATTEPTTTESTTTVIATEPVEYSTITTTELDEDISTTESTTAITEETATSETTTATGFSFFKLK